MYPCLGCASGTRVSRCGALLAQARGREANWRDRVDGPEDDMRHNNYPTKARVLHDIVPFSLVKKSAFLKRKSSRFGAANSVRSIP